MRSSEIKAARKVAVKAAAKAGADAGRAEWESAEWGLLTRSRNGEPLWRSCAGGAHGMMGHDGTRWDTMG